MKPKSIAKQKRTHAKTILRLPDRDTEGRSHQQSFLFDAQRGYRYAIDEFVDWYCSGRDYRSARQL